MFEKQVARGSAWLDRMKPGWYKNIDINELNLGYSDRCTLGLALGPEASAALNVDEEFSFVNGFNVKDVMKRNFFGKMVADRGAIKDNFQILTSKWIQEILRHRESDRLQAEAIKRAGAPR